MHQKKSGLGHPKKSEYFFFLKLVKYTFLLYLGSTRNMHGMKDVMLGSHGHDQLLLFFLMETHIDNATCIHLLEPKLYKSLLVKG